MGLPGLEPGTKGFTLPQCFQKEWTISSSATPMSRWGAGRSSLLLRAFGSLIQLPGSLCTFCRSTGSLAQDCRRPYRYDFPEFIPFISRISPRAHHLDESPALTIVLQAQSRQFYTANCNQWPTMMSGKSTRSVWPLTSYPALTIVLQAQPGGILHFNLRLVGWT